MVKKEQVEIRISEVGRRGDGLGDWQGRPVFVPRALPGELVRAELREDRDKGIAAALLEILEAGPDRVTPGCPHYDSCGGCSLQHWEERAYRSWKAGRPVGLLAKAGLVPAEIKSPVFIPAGTRRRATLAAVLRDGVLGLGFHRARSHDVTDIPGCLILTPRLEALKESLRPHLAGLLKEGDSCAVFMQDADGALDVLLTGPRRKPSGAVLKELAQACGLARLSWRADEDAAPEVMVERAPVTKRSFGLKVELPPGAFLQPSAEGEAVLVAAVMAPFRASNVKRSADLFAGCGTFTGPLMDLGRVQAVESDPAAIAALQKAAARSESLSVVRRNLFSSPLSEKELSLFEGVVLDPPRMGAAEQALHLAHSRVPLVVSISCSASTFVRDARILCGGGYKFESFQVIDQFVWSAHIEMVAVFRR